MADLLNVLLNEGGLSQRQVAVIRFALHRFVNDAHERMNAAAQDKEGRYFKPGAVEAFAADAEDAEAVLARFRTAGVMACLGDGAERRVEAHIERRRAERARLADEAASGVLVAGHQTEVPADDDGSGIGHE